MTLNGVDIIVVETGTKFIHNLTGEELTVDDKSAVSAGNAIYCTEVIYQKLKEHFDNNKRNLL